MNRDLSSRIANDIGDYADLLVSRAIASRPATTLKERFFAKVDQSNGCWQWTAAKNDRGYGQINVDGRLVYAHRVSYEMEKGPIPKGLVVDHLCRNPGCVNPDHLEAVTHRENICRGDLSNNGANHRAKTHCPNGHEYSLENTYNHRGKRHCKECRRGHVRKLRAKKSSNNRGRGRQPVRDTPLPSDSK